MIRKANNDDIVQLNLLRAELHEIHRKNRPQEFCEIEKERFDGDIYEVFSKENAAVFVDEEDGFLTAFTITYLEKTENPRMLVPHSFVRIDELSVAEECRGNGKGRAMLEYIKEYAKEQGADYVCLGVSGFNESAQAFYKACGMSVRSIKMEEWL